MTGRWASLGALGLVAAVGLGCAGLWQERLITTPGPDEDWVMVIVANKELTRGHQIEEEDLYAVEMPVCLLPNGVFLSPDHVVGRFVEHAIDPDDLVNGDSLADPESGEGLSSLVPRGMRAVAVGPVDRLPDRAEYVDLWREEADGRCLLVEAFVMPGEALATVLVAEREVPRVLDAVDAGDLSLTKRIRQDLEPAHGVVRCSG